MILVCLSNYSIIPKCSFRDTEYGKGSTFHFTFEAEECSQISTYRAQALVLTANVFQHKRTIIFGPPSETRKHLERTFIYLGFYVLSSDGLMIDQQSQDTSMEPPHLIIFIHITHSISSESMGTLVTERYPHARFLYIGARRPLDTPPSAHLEYLSTPLKTQSLSQVVQRLMSVGVEHPQGTLKEAASSKKPKPIPRIAEVCAN